MNCFMSCIYFVYFKIDFVKFTSCFIFDIIGDSPIQLYICLVHFYRNLKLYPTILLDVNINHDFKRLNI